MPTRIFIIDDDQDYKSIVIKRVKGCVPDADIKTVANLTEARNYLEKHKEGIDLIILDEHLPDGRGSEFMNEGWFGDMAVLSMSSDTAPEVPAASMMAGAMFFLSKTQVNEKLFEPLVLGLIERNRVFKELQRVKEKALIGDTIKTLIATLRHEINNPLGAVLGAAYLMRQGSGVTNQQLEAASLVELSGKRIKYVLDQLCQAAEVESVKKADRKVFQIPGDKKWDE